MKKLTKIFVAAALCFILQMAPQNVTAQDASNPEVARSDNDDSDWGLLGLLGLIGLLGLKKKDRKDPIVIRDRTS
jgi:MYXO-CTERM domain-containing protein